MIQLGGSLLCSWLGKGVGGRSRADPKALQPKERPKSLCVYMPRAYEWSVSPRAWASRACASAEPMFLQTRCSARASEGPRGGPRWAGPPGGGKNRERWQGREKL